MLFEDLDTSFELPTHVSPPPTFPKSSRSLLRYHFQRCLRVHFCGGDIKDEYPSGTISSFLEDVGLWDPSESSIVPFDDPRWRQTALARAVAQSYLGKETAGELENLEER
jgi:hypothetical protein